MDRDLVDALRRFNRTHSQRVGTVDESFLGTGRAYGVARLLFEIGPSGTTSRDLRTRLGLDSGYLSRLLRQLERDSLVTVRVDPDDRRRRRVELTDEGHAAWRELDTRSDQRAAQLVVGLTATQQAELAGALDRADRLLRVAGIRFEVIDPRAEPATRAMTAYFDELAVRFDTGFDPGDTLVADAPAMTAPIGAFVVGLADADVVACGGVQRHDPRTGEIKRMWVHRDWRGLGVGRRMLGRLEAEVRALGFDRVVLDTNDSLVEAIAMYERAGYAAIDRYNDNPYARCWFAKPLSASRLGSDPNRDG